MGVLLGIKMGREQTLTESVDEVSVKYTTPTINGSAGNNCENGSDKAVAAASEVSVIYTTDATEF
jgi:hypothetical protein